MIDRIDVTSGDVGWRQAAPLLQAVWAPEVVATLPWRDVAWAAHDQRVLAFNAAGEIIGHVAIIMREATLDGRAVKIGGLGGVATRNDSRRRGVARATMSTAVQQIQCVHDVDFCLLFCEPRHAALYEKLGWHSFQGDVFVQQAQGRVRFEVTGPYVIDFKMAPRFGVLDLCGLPW
jgi:aminoglycoside 2'-N-acetyltransferase I